MDGDAACRGRDYLRNGRGGESSRDRRGRLADNRVGRRRGDVHAASPRAGGWAKTKVSGPDVYVYPSFTEGVALDVDEQGRAVAAWRGSPEYCVRSPHALEATVRGEGTASWEATRRLATFEFEAWDPCEFASNPAVVLTRDTALLAWREDRAPTRACGSSG